MGRDQKKGYMSLQIFHSHALVNVSSYTVEELYGIQEVPLLIDPGE